MTTRVAATFRKQDRPAQTVLRVDDNPDDLLLFQLAWERAPVADPVRSASSRTEAMDYLEGRGKFADRKAFPLPSVVVIDMRLPDGNAAEFVRWIRAHPKLNRMVVIVLSGSARQEEINEAYRCGANSFLLKSANPAHLDHTVNLIQAYWLTQNFPPAAPLRSQVT